MYAQSALTAPPRETDDHLAFSQVLRAKADDIERVVLRERAHAQRERSLGLRYRLALRRKLPLCSAAQRCASPDTNEVTPLKPETLAAWARDCVVPSPS